MDRKTAFVNEIFLKALNQHQQPVPPAVQKAATLDDEVGEILNKKHVNNHDKAKLYSYILFKKIADSQRTNYAYRKPITSSYANHTFVHVQKRINLGNFLKIQDTSGKHVTFP